MQPLKVAGIVSIVALSVQLSVALPSTKAVEWQDHQTPEDPTPSLSSALANPHQRQRIEQDLGLQLLVPRLSSKFKELMKGGGSSSKKNKKKKGKAPSSSSSSKRSSPAASPNRSSPKALTAKASSNKASSPARSASSADTVEMAMRPESASEIREQYRQQEEENRRKQHAEWQAAQDRIHWWMHDAANRKDDDD